MDGQYSGRAEEPRVPLFEKLIAYTIVVPACWIFSIVEERRERDAIERRIIEDRMFRDVR